MDSRVASHRTGVIPRMRATNTGLLLSYGREGVSARPCPAAAQPASTGTITSTSLRVLILEDRPEDAELILHELRRAGFEPDWQRVDTEADYLAQLDQAPDLILADYALPQYDALRALHLLKNYGLHIPFIVVTGRISEEAAVECMKQGAADYLLKDRLARLGQAVKRALEQEHLRTTRERAEEGLRQSEARYRSIFEGVQDAIFVESLTGEVLDVNARACEMYGWSREEFLRKTVRDLVPEGNLAVIASEMERENLPDQPVETVNIRACGELFPVEITTQLQAIGHKTVMLVMVRDITARKRAEEALRESEERFRNVAQTAADGIVLADNNCRILYWNRAAETIFGYSGEEALGKRLSTLMPKQYVDLTLKSIERVWRTGGSDLLGEDVEMHGLRKDGEEFPMDLCLSSWESNGEKYCSAMIRDVTEARGAQKSAQLRDRLAVVGQLAAGIAHDFNNILGTIILYSELMLNGGDQLPEDRARLTTIIEQAQRGANLTAQVLDFSRRSVMERHPMDLAPFMNDLIRLLERTLPESIRVKLSLEGESFVVMADPTRMQQVIMNLAFNARDAMPEGGELRFDLSRLCVEPGMLPCRDMAPGEWVRVRVSDTGTGISTDALPHIFEPFFTTKPPDQGTGLGLAQVYGIIKQHDGYIDVMSQEQEGTTFIIYMPALEDAVSPRLIPDPVCAKVGHAETILVVEDDEATRRAACEILESLNYRVLVAADGQEALRIFQQRAEEIELLITDLIMPALGGVALYQKLRELHPTVHVVVMTGYPMDAGTRELLERGSVTWMQKPLGTEALARTVRKVLAGRD